MYIRIIKPVLDWIFALIFLAGCSPLMIAAAVAIKREDGGSILFRQKRPGKDGKIFTIYKFRSMIENNEPEVITGNDMTRMTRTGRFIRRFSIDELPQLFNVIKGEMSFVGPRPLLVDYLPYYDENQARRHDVKPGLTGLAQVSGRNELSWDDRLNKDIEYVGEMCFILDAKIVIMTIIKILSGSGVNRNEYETMVRFDDYAREKK
ncbi:MAG: sugar transferase [Clostridia bacterium]|nr:sugar transferase [Clostridia bacterium]